MRSMLDQLSEITAGTGSTAFLFKTIDQSATAAAALNPKSDLLEAPWQRCQIAPMQIDQP
jgi:hypothetical protein